MAAEILVFLVVEIESDNWNFPIRKRLAIFQFDAGKPDGCSEFIDVSRLQIRDAEIAKHIFFAWTALQYETAVAVFAPRAFVKNCASDPG